MKMVSYWKKSVNGEGESITPEPFYSEDEDFHLIYGYYDHENAGNPEKRLGIYWREDFPHNRSNNILTPLVVPPITAKGFLTGLFFELLSKGQKDKAEKVAEAIKFLCNE
jgi:hypothetical protein